MIVFINRAHHCNVLAAKLVAIAAAESFACTH